MLFLAWISCEVWTFRKPGARLLGGVVNFTVYLKHNRVFLILGNGFLFVTCLVIVEKRDLWKSSILALRSPCSSPLLTLGNCFCDDILWCCGYYKMLTSVKNDKKTTHLVLPQPNPEFFFSAIAHLNSSPRVEMIHKVHEEAPQCKCIWSGHARYECKLPNTDTLNELQMTQIWRNIRTFAIWRTFLLSVDCRSDVQSNETNSSFAWKVQLDEDWQMREL